MYAPYPPIIVTDKHGPRINPDNTDKIMDQDKPAGAHGSDEHMGAVEGDKATDPQEGNANVDERGNPKDDVAICEDVLGANVDGTEG
jgi:hypothetical protein